MNKNYVMLILAGLLMCSNANLLAQDQPIGNSRFVMTLQDTYVQRLKSSGSLQSPVREDAQGKIAAIQIQFSESATDAPLVVDAQTSVNGNVCQVVLDDATIDLARTQPIRVNIQLGSVFSKVFLIYEKPVVTEPDLTDSLDNASPPSPASPAATSSNDINFYQHYVQLSDNETIVGQMDLAQEIKFTTKFGEVDISFGQIAGIRFHIDGEDAAMIVLKNGDSITGSPASSSFEMNTDWGRAEFDPVFVEAITTSQNAKFHQTNEPGFGSRWQLIGR